MTYVPENADHGRRWPSVNSFPHTRRFAANIAALQYDNKKTTSARGSIGHALTPLMQASNSLLQGEGFFF
jgi:hypothetical protein